MGAPLGNDHACKDREWKFAIRRALARAEDDPSSKRKLAHIADALLDKAADGDLTAIKELGDRLDGKPAQAIVGGGEGSEPINAAIRVLFGRD